MAMVRLKVNAPVFGWNIGDIVEVERTPRVAGAIANGYCTVLADVVPDIAADGGPAFPPTLMMPSGVDAKWVPYRDPDAETPAASMGVHGKLSAAVAVVPPRTGKGSGAAAWRKFLDEQGVDHTAVQLEDRAALIRLWDDEVERRGL